MMKRIEGNRGLICMSSLISVLLFTLIQAAVVAAQSTSLPVTGQYPGGHVGIRGGASPPGGFKKIMPFLRIQDNYALKDSNGNTIDGDDKTLIANINILDVVTDWKLLGGNYGFMAAIPFNETVMRPYNEQGRQPSGFGLGDTIFVPAILYWKAGSFDYQAGLGFFAPTGKFEEGSSDNNGSGYWAGLLSLGGVWYPGGDRKSWSVSAVSRWELNGTQKDTDINVGDVVVVDWGIGKLFEVGQSLKTVLDVGVSGFAEWQLTRQSGPDPGDDPSKYRVFAIGPEIQWAIPKWKLSFLVRAQFEFGARNTSQSNNYWFNIGYTF